MRILYYSSHPNLALNSTAGYGTHMREIIQAFRLFGHEVLPVIMGGGETENANSADKKTNSSYKNMLKTIAPKYIWESLKDYNLLRFDNYSLKVLSDKVAEFKPDIIYERAAYLQTSGVEVAKKFGIYHFLEVNSPYPEEQINLVGASSFFHKKGNEMEKRQAELTNRLVVVSSALQKYYIDKYQISNDKFILTPNAIDVTKISINEDNKNFIRQKYSLDNYKVIGFAGSVFPWHGVDMLVNSFNELYTKYSNIKLMIVGDSTYLSIIKEKTAKMPCTNDIIYVGNVPHEQVFDYLANIDIAVMPQSNWYGSPIKIFEYAAMGKPIIAPDYVPLQDVMENGKDGLLIQPSTQNLSSAIEYLLLNEEKAKVFAECFHNKVMTQYQWKFIAQKILADF